MSISEKLTAIAENEQKVYDAGKQAEWDAFWDAYQKNGTRQIYDYAFAGSYGWTGETFKPKYDFTPKSIMYMFYQSPISVDLPDTLEKLGVKWDMSSCTSADYAFYGSRFTRLGEINLSQCVVGLASFGNCKNLAIIDKIICSEMTNFETNTFYQCSNLQSVIFEGVFANNGLSFTTCPKLTVESLRSLIGILQEKSSGTWKITLGSNVAKLTDTDRANIQKKGWTYS